MGVFERIFDLIQAGGWVMYPLILLSVASVTVSLERLAFWTGDGSAAAGRRTSKAVEHAAASRYDDARKAASKQRGIYARFLTRVLADGSKAPTELDAKQHAESLRPAIERFDATMSTIITAAPMLGILGTVTGIIQSFRLIGGDGPITDPTVVAGGIAEALITTAFGLTIALVTLFPYAVSRAKSEQALVQLEIMAEALVDRQETGD